MTTTKNKAAKSEVVLENALAVLISCTRNRARPLSLIEIAKSLDIAVRHLGSYAAVADRLGLSSKMLRQFAYVRRLSRGVQRLFERRELDSVDAATHLAMLPRREQQTAAKALSAGRIDTVDLRAVVELRRLGSPSSIASLLRQVADSKVKQQYLAEFVVRGPRKRQDLMKAFSRHIPASEILALEINGALGRLVLTHRGKQALAKAAGTLQVPLKHVIPIILRSQPLL